MDWRRGWDSNPRCALTAHNGLANRRLQPLGHPSARRDTTFASCFYGVGPAASNDQVPQESQMAEKALTAVIQEAYIQGVSTRSVDVLVETMGMPMRG